MGLFRSLRRVTPQAAAEDAGGKASDIKATPQAVAESVTLDDFKAEVTACDLGEDWKAVGRLEHLFAVFDLDGNGQVNQEEFSRTAQQLRKLLQALEGVCAKEKKHEAAMPPLLASFTPLKELDQVSNALAKLKPLEEKLLADAANNAKQKALATELESAKAVLTEAIDKRLSERGIAPLCDAVIAIGDDFFVNTYTEIWAGIAKSEAAGVKSCEGDADHLLDCAKKGGGAAGHGAAAHRNWLQKQGAKDDALQRHHDIPSLYAAALRAQGGFADVLKSIEANVPELGSVKPGQIKGTARILEKVLLQHDNPGCTNRVCDVVRALLEVSSMAQLSAVLRAIAKLHEEGTIVVLRVKDRTRQPSSGGWRDVMINLYVASNEDRHVCEIQVAHAKMLTAREGLDGHAIYGKQRNAAELMERQGVGGKQGRGTAAVLMLQKALAADQFAPEWARLKQATDASALPEETRRAAAEAEGDDLGWLQRAMEAIMAASGGSIEAIVAMLKGEAAPKIISPDGPELPIHELLGIKPVESIQLTGAWSRGSVQGLGPLSACIIGFCIALGASSSLAHLYLSQNNIDDEGAKALAAGVAASGSLASLDIGENKLGVEGAKAIAEALCASGSLADLNLMLNNIGDEGAKALAAGVAASGSLATLNIINNKIGVKGAKHLAEAIRASGSLATLNLRCNDIGEEGAKALAVGVAASGSLTSLNLDSNNIGPHGAQAIANVICASSSLAKLHLDRNNIGDEGAKALAEGVAASGSLATLYLGANRIGDEGAKALAEAVAASGSLAELHLYVNNIGDEGAKALAAGVAASGSLGNLSIGSNKIGKEGAKAIADAVAASGSLGHLSIDRNKISKEGAEALADALAASGSLTSLGLQYCELSWLTKYCIGRKAKKALQKAGKARSSLKM